MQVEYNAIMKRVAWNKGLKMSLEQRAKLSKAHKLNPTRYWLGKTRKFPNRKKPKPFSESHRLKISLALKGVTPWNKGKSVDYAGKKHHSWIDGRSRSREQARSTEMKHAPYREWRRKVFNRDVFSCRVCFFKGYIIAHHIKLYSKFPNLRFIVENGITLCKPCHKMMAGKEHLFEKELIALLKNGFNSAKPSLETTPSQQEELRKVFWARVTVRGE